MARKAVKRSGGKSVATSKKKPAAAEVPKGPTTVSGARLAGVLADPPFSDRWLRELADKGFVVKSGRGEYLLEPSVQGYIRFIRETEVKAATDAANAKEQFETERARKFKLENDAREALLIETPEALAAIDHIFGEVRTALAGIPAKATNDVALRRQIDDAIDAILTDLADRLEQSALALRTGRDPLEADAPVNA